MIGRCEKCKNIVLNISKTKKHDISSWLSVDGLDFVSSTA